MTQLSINNVIKNKFDYLDLIATVLGAIPMLILILIPIIIFKLNS